MFYETKSVDFPNVQRFDSFRTVGKKLPAEFAAGCKESYLWLKKNRFAVSRVYFVPGQLASPARAILLYRHASGKAILCSQVIEDEFSGTREIVACISAMPDGVFAVTTNSDEEQFSSENVQIRQFVGAGVRDLIKRHQKNFVLKSAVSIHDTESCEQIFFALHDEMIETLKANDIVKELVDGNSEVYENPFVDSEPAESLNVDLSLDATGDSETVSPRSQPIVNENQRQVLLAIKEIQTNQIGATGNIALLLVSIVLFVAIGGFAWSWLFVLLLIPILLVHELGHFVAMKWFQYANVKMFFIPLLGAAVSGRNVSADGWKKTLVSLAGPLPSLLLAVPLSVATIWFDHEWLRHGTMLVVFLNLFNLLPFLPLDGGWVMHSLYFCRSPILDSVFRAIAGIGLIGLAFLLSSRFLGFFGVYMLIILPMQFTQTKIASLLKSRNLDLSLDSNGSIPVASAVQIIDEMPKSGALQGNPKSQAHLVLQIFDLLSSKPPSWAATIGLTFLYFCGWLAGIAAVLMLTIGHLFNSGFLPDGDSFSTRKVAVTIEHLQRRNETAEDVGKDDRREFIVEFESSSQAEDFFNRLQHLGVPVLLVENLIVGTVEPRQEQDFAPVLVEMQQIAESCKLRSESGYVFQIECVAASVDQAEKLKAEFELINVQGIVSGLTARWTPGQRISEEQMERRIAFGKLMALDDETYKSPQYQALVDTQAARVNIEELTNEEIVEANRQFQMEVAALRKSLLKTKLKDGARHEELLNHFFAKFDIDSSDTSTDELLDQWEDRQKIWNRKTGQLLGSVSFDKDQNLPKFYDNRFGCYSIACVLEGIELRLNAIEFVHSVDGLYALLIWLDEQDCMAVSVRALDRLRLFEEEVSSNRE